MNTCECGGEIDIGCVHGRWLAVCRECEGIYPLVATSRIDAEKEWNNEVSVPWSTPEVKRK